MQAEQRRSEMEQRRLERVRAAARERAGDGQGEDIGEHDLPGALVENPEILPLGYFRRRRHPRLKYACAVILERGNIKSSAVTRDISVCGVQVLVKGLTALQLEQEVTVSDTVPTLFVAECGPTCVEWISMHHPYSACWAQFCGEHTSLALLC